MHIPDDPAYYEKFYFTPGDLGYKVFKTKFANIGVLDLLGSMVSGSSKNHFTDGCRNFILPNCNWLGTLHKMKKPILNNTMHGKPFNEVMPLPMVCM